MFPVPAHLPRTGGEHISGPAQDDMTATTDPASEQESVVLALLEPLIEAPKGASESVAPPTSGAAQKKKAARWSAKEIREVRESLEKAVAENKTKTHRLVLDNLPTISHGIQLSSSLRTGMDQVKAKLEALEREIDIMDPATSFLPPLVTVLNNHFSSLSTLNTSSAYISALKSLHTRAQNVSKLEQAVWSGATADSWVLDALSSEHVAEDGSQAPGIQDTKAVKALDHRKNELYKQAVQQLLGGWAELVTVKRQGQGVVVKVRNEVKLPAPQGARPSNLETTPTPQYSQATILQALSSLGLLSQSLQSLQSQLLEDVVNPIMTSRYTANLSSSEGEAFLSTEPSASAVGEAQVLEGVRSFLSFLSSNLIPDSIPLPETSSFLRSTTTSTLQALLDDFILPLLPSSPAVLPAWISLLQTALEIESSQPGSSLSFKEGPISRFFQSQAAIEYATKRRYDSAELVRGLVLRGWHGWEGFKWEREREVVGVVEVMVIDDEEAEDQSASAEKEEPGKVEDNGVEEDDGWGFDEPVSIPPKEEEVTTEAAEDDGWGFDEPIALSKSESDPDPIAIPSSGFTPPEPPKSIKPPREAKRLGKKAVKKPKEHDPWDPAPDAAPTPSEVSEASSSRPETPASVTPVSEQETNGNGVGIVEAGFEPKPKPKAPREAKRLGKKVGKQAKKEYDPWDVDAPVAAPAPVPAPTPLSASDSSPALTEETEEGWGWEKDTAVAPVPVEVPAIKEDVVSSPKKRKRSVLKEERKVVKEVYQVSKGCEELLTIARGLLQEVHDLKSTKLESPSFNDAATYTIIHQAIAEVFTLYRALLPTYYSQQLLEVPSLALQAYNDTNFLSFSLPSLSSSTDPSETPWDSGREQEALLVLGDHLLESFITNQLGQIDTELEGVNRLEGTGDDAIFRESEKCVKGLVFELESLSRVIKPVIPQSERYPLLGTLLTHFTSRLSSFVLSLSDITEIESNRLTELVRLVYPLENLFTGGEGVVGHVRGWLKFCYIAEILQANLVDITYLLDQNALVDFTPDELIGLVGALFASSEKRDKVIDRIEAEGTGGGGNQKHHDEVS